MSSAHFIIHCAGFQEVDKVLVENRAVLGLALPDREDLPPGFDKRSPSPTVPFLVPADLGFPKFAVGGREGGPGAVMPMPEAPVNEYNAFPGWENQIGSSGKVFAM
jgi:hypothetical protein